MSMFDIIVELAVFALVVAVSLSALRRAEAIWDVRRRLRGAEGEAELGLGPVLRDRGPDNSFFRWIESWSSLSDAKDKVKLTRDLRMAGFDHPSAPVLYVIGRLTLAISLPLAFLMAQSFNAKRPAGPLMILVALGLCGLGLIVPKAVVDNRANARRAKLEQEFPDALDLMVICVQAGLGLEAAFVRVCDDVKESHPRIAEEFNRVSEELRAGRSRADALRSLADRADVDAVKSFVALLIQTDSLGTSIGQTLRSYSLEMRETRFLKAEEKAMRVPVLMTIPLVACILPVIVTALLLPPIIDVVRNLLPAMAGRH